MWEGGRGRDGGKLGDSDRATRIGRLGQGDSDRVTRIGRVLKASCRVAVLRAAGGGRQRVKMSGAGIEPCAAPTRRRAAPLDQSPRSGAATFDERTRSGAAALRSDAAVDAGESAPRPWRPAARRPGRNSTGPCAFS